MGLSPADGGDDDDDDDGAPPRANGAPKDAYGSVAPSESEGADGRATPRSLRKDEPQCAQEVRGGKRCANKCLAGTGFCWRHQPKED